VDFLGSCRNVSRSCTDTHSEYVIVSAFPRQHWLRERASMLRYAYIACLVYVWVEVFVVVKIYIAVF
jgi:hypothetical protein